MGRHVNVKCQHCATLNAQEAIALHGSSGDNCWNPGNEQGWGYDCHRRRSHYRNRDDLNRTRRRLRKHGKSDLAQPSTPAPERYIDLLPPPTCTAYAAVLVLYRNKKDSPVHAIGAEIWQANRKVIDIRPGHCMGMRGPDVTTYIENMLFQLRDRFGVSRFEDVIKELPVDSCPLVPCPLKPDSA